METLDDKTFCFAGTFEKISRPQAAVAALGGEIVDAVTADLDVLVMGNKRAKGRAAAQNKATKLNEKAKPKAKQIQIIDEAKLLGMLKPTDDDAIVSLLKQGRSGVAIYSALVDAMWRELTGPKLRELDFQGDDLRGLTLHHASISKSKFSGADLREARFYHVGAPGASFRAAKLAGAKLFDVVLNNTKFRGADLSGATIIGTGEKASFAQCDLRGGCLRGSFTDADFSQADLRDADLSDCDLTGARFKEAQLRGCHRHASFVADDAFEDTASQPLDANVKPKADPLFGIDTLMRLLETNVDVKKLGRAVKMLKEERFHLFSEANERALVGIVKSQTGRDLIYSCELNSNGRYGCLCCEGDLYACWGMSGAVCKHILVLVVGLCQAEELDPATAFRWVKATQTKKPTQSEETMSDTLLKYKGALAGEIDWRPTETVPEDYYAM